MTVLRSWLAERGGLPADPLFATRRGTPLSRDALERRIAKYTAIAAKACPALREKKVSPHVLRHSAAMRLLNAGVDTSVIALWMGHENVATTQVYIHADLALKERAIARTAPQDDCARPLPAARRRAGVPRRTVIMPNIRCPPTRTTAAAAMVGITARSA